MTELEQQLLSAFDALENEWQKQQAASEQALKDLQRMFEASSAENKELKAQIYSLGKLCSGLAERVASLSEQVASLSRKL